jgi:hypothetical protein
MAVRLRYKCIWICFRIRFVFLGCAAAWQGPLTEARFRLVDADAVQQYLYRWAASLSSIKLVAKEAGYFGTAEGIQS